MMTRSTKVHKQFIYFILISCILLGLSCVECTPFTEYNYTFNIHSSKVHDYSQINGIKLYNQNFTGEVLDEFLIKEPKQIDNVVQIITRFNANKSSLNISAQTQINPNQLLSAPQIDKVWIDYYSWPIKKNSLYYSAQFQQKSEQKQKSVIVSAVYVPLTHKSPIQKILNNNLQMYVLLSTGQIQLVSKNYQQLTVQKIYQYDFQGQNQQEKQWSDAYLYHKNGRLHLFIDQTFYFVSLNQIDDGKQKRVFYQLYKLTGVSPVLKVVQTNQLHIFTDKGCYKINKNKAEQVISYSKILQMIPQAKKEFIDFTIFGNKIYFLNQQSGIVVYSQGKYKLLRIQHPELASGIDVQNETIMVTYEVTNQQYVQEYHLVENQQQLYVNKVYSYHSDEPINDILLFDKEIIINRGSQILHGIHSLSRKLPYAFYKQTQVLQSKSYNDQVIQLRAIYLEGLKLPGYMAITEKSIELIEFQSHLGQDIQQKWVSITSELSGIYNFDIQFIGTCKQSSFYPPIYCSITKNVQLVVNDRVNEQITSWWIWICIAIGSIFILSVSIAILCTYFSRKQNQFESLIESKKLRKQGSTVVEMSFENTSQITEEKDK